MSRHKYIPEGQAGFSLVELLVTITLLGIVAAVIYTSFNTSIVEYYNLQKQGTNFTGLATQSQRVANVLRGATDIVSATNSDLVVYAYFSPTDNYVSKVHYYKSANNTKLFADVTQMTANPPTGTEIVGSTKTYTIFNNFYQAPGVKLFTYTDAAGAEITTPIADLHTVKGIKVRLAVPSGDKNKAQSVDLQVSLRNRKTNL